MWIKHIPKADGILFMIPLLFIIACTLGIAQLFVPRRIAFSPLLLAAFHVPDIQFLPNLSVIRIIILAGLIRAFKGHIYRCSLRNPLDRLMIMWAGLAILTGFAHSMDNGNPVILRFGMVFDYVGSYLYARIYIKDSSDILRFGRCLVFVMVPLAMLLIVEKISGQNSYEALGATFKMIRHGHVRAAGPFGNAILAGTAGGTSIPLLVMLFRDYRSYSIVGILTACLIVFCSSSSGSYLTLFVSIVGLLFWRWRSYVAWVRKCVVVSLIGLHLVMNDPVWYLTAYVDIGGGSTGYHRAELITQALNHIEEWWLTGTDYTRHWMPYGIDWSGNHIDITNYYLKMGVLGGLPLMIAFVAILSSAFGLIGRRIGELRAEKNLSEFMLWCVGVALFAHCISFLGVAYFDQSYIFLFMVIGAIPGLVISCPQNHTDKIKESAPKVRYGWVLNKPTRNSLIIPDSSKGRFYSSSRSDYE
jgi:hypothetical protein